MAKFCERNHLDPVWMFPQDELAATESMLVGLWQMQVSFVTAQKKRLTNRVAAFSRWQDDPRCKRDLAAGHQPWEVAKKFRSRMRAAEFRLKSSKARVVRKIRQAGRFAEAMDADAGRDQETVYGVVEGIEDDQPAEPETRMKEFSSRQRKVFQAEVSRPWSKKGRAHEANFAEVQQRTWRGKRKKSAAAKKKSLQALSKKCKAASSASGQRP